MKTIVAIVVVIVVIAGGVLLFYRPGTTKTNSGPVNTMSSSSASNSQASNSAPATTTNSVTIQNFAFSPASITVKKGTTVTWTNQDSATHTVTEADGQTGPNSGDLATGKSYSFTFNSVGTFKYHCSIHPDMTGTVTVTE